MMKKNNTFILAYILLLPSILFSCSTIEDSTPPYHYTMKIRFEDSAGKDKVRGIDYIEDSKIEISPENRIYEIKKIMYKLDVMQTGKSKETLSSGSLHVQITDSYDCLILSTTIFSLPFNGVPQLTHKLICPYIFGNSDEQLIISNWERGLCTSIIFDNKTYSATETDTSGNSIFVVQLSDK